MEWIRNYNAVRWGIGLIVLFFVSLFKSCSEIEHSLWGIETTAQISRSQPSSYDKRDHYLTLSFSDEHGRLQNVKRTVRLRDQQFHQGDEVPVIYLAGDPAHVRLVAERSWTWPVVFVVMVAASIVWCAISIRQVKAGKFEL